MAGQEAQAAYADPQEGDQPTADERPAAAKLLAFLDDKASLNLVPLLTDEQLAEIARKAIDGYNLDDKSRETWKQRNEDAMKLAALLTEEKNYPFPNAANVKYPLITVGALQFNARAYPAIVQGDRVAKAKVNGHDPDGQKAKRADRVSEHASWQLTSEMPEWEEDTDRLLILLPIVGCAFRKRYWDPTLGRQATRLVTADRFVYNYHARSVEDCPRLSEELCLYPHEIAERINDGRFIDFDYGEPAPDDKTSETDPDGPHKFIEQHRLIDLDGDDYAEPYIVTIHLETQKVCRITPNFDRDSVRVTADGKVLAVRRRDYYAKYVFWPSPDGGSYGMGLGWLLNSTNQAINSTMNEMLDAGHLANVQGGFISAVAGIREKTIRLNRGEFKVLNTALPANQAVMPIKFDGPSATLFQLLGLLIEQGKDVANTKDILTGDTGGKVIQPLAIQQLIQQGMQVFNAIFKRVHRALKQELVIHADLNAKYLSAEAYNAFFDGPEQYDPKVDYDLKDMAVTPVSDPSVATPMQRLAKSQVALQLGQGKPFIDQVELTRRAFEAAEITDIDKLFVQPDPKTAAFSETMQHLAVLKEVESINKLSTAQILDIANAAGVEGDQALALFEQFRASLETQHNMEQQNAQVPGGPGQLPPVAGAPGDQMGGGTPQGAGAGDGADGAGQPVGAAPGGPSPVGGAAAASGAPAGAG